MTRKTRTISFTEYDDDIYELFIKEKNGSSLIRHLLRCHYGKINPDSFYKNFNQPQIANEKEPEIEEKTSPLGITKYDDESNRVALEGIMDAFD